MASIENLPRKKIAVNFPFKSLVSESKCDDVIPAEGISHQSVTRGESLITPLQEIQKPTESEPKILSSAEEKARKFEKIKHNLGNPLKSDKPKKKEDKLKADKKNESVWSVGPRKASEITVSFSPRYFPSAARESLAAEENDVRN